MKRLLAALVLLLPFAVHADSGAAPTPRIVLHQNVEVRRFYGYAYDLHTGKYLYTEVHEQHIENRQWIGGTTTFFAPDGSEIARKVLDFSQDPYIPLFRLDVTNVHYSEGISRITPKTVYLFKQGVGDSAPEQGTVPHLPDMAADSGFDNLIRAKFPEVLKGKPLTFPFAIAGKLDYYRFTISRLKDGTFENRKAVRFKVELSSLLRLLVGKPLILTYTPDTHRLVEYRGVSDLYNPKTDKPYMVRVDYYSQPPPDAPKHLPPLDPGPGRH